MIVYNIEWDTTIDEEDENNFKKNLNRIEIPEYVYNLNLKKIINSNF